MHPKGWKIAVVVTMLTLSVTQVGCSRHSKRLDVMESIKCVVTNDAAFDNTYELFDNVSNAPVPQSPLVVTAHGQATIDLRSSQALDDGYGSFKSRVVGNQTWNNFDLIRNGETRSLN